MADIQEIEHTADWAIRVRAADARELFAGAAAGMFGLLADPGSVAAEREIPVQLAAVDLETLLVDWLNELLYAAERDGLVFVRFDLDVLDEAAPCRLEARAAGGRPRALSKAIKAATFSGLHIAPVAGGLEATIVFDV